jgi:hypothetical protein
VNWKRQLYADFKLMILMPFLKQNISTGALVLQECYTAKFAIWSPSYWETLWVPCSMMKQLLDLLAIEDGTETTIDVSGQLIGPVLKG